MIIFAGGAQFLAVGLLAAGNPFAAVFAGLLHEPALLRRLVDEIHRPEQGILPFLSRIGEYLVGEQQLGRIAPGTDVQAFLGVAGSLAARGFSGADQLYGFALSSRARCAAFSASTCVACATGSGVSSRSM